MIFTSSTRDNDDVDLMTLRSFSPSFFFDLCLFFPSSCAFFASSHSLCLSSSPLSLNPWMFLFSLFQFHFCFFLVVKILENLRKNYSSEMIKSTTFGRREGKEEESPPRNSQLFFFVVFVFVFPSILVFINFCNFDFSSFFFEDRQILSFPSLSFCFNNYINENFNENSRYRYFCAFNYFSSYSSFVSPKFYISSAIFLSSFSSIHPLGMFVGASSISASSSSSYSPVSSAVSSSSVVRKFPRLVGSRGFSRFVRLLSSGSLRPVVNGRSDWEEKRVGVWGRLGIPFFGGKNEVRLFIRKFNREGGIGSERRTECGAGGKDGGKVTVREDDDEFYNSQDLYRRLCTVPVHALVNDDDQLVVAFQPPLPDVLDSSSRGGNDEEEEILMGEEGRKGRGMMGKGFFSRLPWWPFGRIQRKRRGGGRGGMGSGSMIGLFFMSRADAQLYLEDIEAKDQRSSREAPLRIRTLSLAHFYSFLKGKRRGEEGGGPMKILVPDLKELETTLKEASRGEFWGTPLYVHKSIWLQTEQTTKDGRKLEKRKWTFRLPVPTEKEGSGGDVSSDAVSQEEDRGKGKDGETEKKEKKQHEEQGRSIKSDNNNNLQQCSSSNETHHSVERDTDSREMMKGKKKMEEEMPNRRRDSLIYYRPMFFCRDNAEKSWKSFRERHPHLNLPLKLELERRSLEGEVEKWRRRFYEKKKRRNSQNGLEKETEEEEENVLLVPSHRGYTDVLKKEKNKKLHRSFKGEGKLRKALRKGWRRWKRDWKQLIGIDLNVGERVPIV